MGLSRRHCVDLAGDVRALGRGVLLWDDCDEDEDELGLCRAPLGLVVVRVTLPAPEDADYDRWWRGRCA